MEIEDRELKIEDKHEKEDIHEDQEIEVDQGIEVETDRT